MFDSIILLVGVIIGAAVGILTTHVQNKHNKSMYVLEKRNEVYLPIVETFLEATREININVDDVLDSFQKLTLTSNLLLYASNDVKTKFLDLREKVLRLHVDMAENKPLDFNSMRSIDTEYLALIDIMRTEIGIKK